MPNNDRIIVGIDVGTHKICTIVAETTAGGGTPLNVLGVGAVASEGVAKGMITDIVKASTAIGHSLEAAERQSGCRILSGFVSISGSHVASTNSRGLVAVSSPDRVIGTDDVERAIDAARAMAMPAGRDVLHVIPRSYIVDGQEGIENPLGLSGFRLDVETHVITGATNVRENLVRCAQRAPVEVDDLVVSPLASAESVLTEQEKRMGVAVVDIGHGTSDIAIYAEGAVWHTKVIPVGGWHLTNDLVLVFSIPYDAAEALKLQYGEATAPDYNRQAQMAAQLADGKTRPQDLYVHAQAARSGGTAHGSATARQGHASVAAGVTSVAAEAPGRDLSAFVPESQPGDDMLETRDFEGNPCLIARTDLNAVMAARLDQILQLVGDEIRRSGYDGLLPAGVVLTGGVASMPGVERLAGQKLKMPVRVGRPRKIGGLASVFEGPMYATSVGLVLWGLRQGSGQSGLVSLSPQGRPPERNGQQRSKLAQWLSMFLPRES